MIPANTPNARLLRIATATTAAYANPRIQGVTEGSGITAYDRADDPGSDRKPARFWRVRDLRRLRLQANRFRAGQGGPGSVTRHGRTGTLLAVRLVPSFALAGAIALSACTDGGSGPGTDEGGVDDSADALRLGRVHVVLASSSDADRDGEVEVTARFALVRGLDEEFVRARADMPDLPEDVLSPGQCASESSLWPPELRDDDVADLDRELQLIDAGELAVQLGDVQLDVPLSLVPDLLPYMSGVEYVYFAEEMPLDDMIDRQDATVSVAAAGGLTEDLPAFSVDGTVPAAVGLSFTADDLASIDQGALVLRWNGSSDADAELALRLTPTLRGEPLGDDVVCLVSDRGQTRLDLAELRTLGFAPEADGVHVEASRTTATLFDVGAFAGSELLVERRDAADLPLR